MRKVLISITFFLLLALCSCEMGPTVALVLDANNGSSVKEYSRGIGSEIRLPLPKRNGYTFACWYDSDGNTYDAGSAFTIPSSNVSLFGSWNTIIEIKTKTGELKNTIQVRSGLEVDSFPLPYSMGAFFNYLTFDGSTQQYSKYSIPTEGPNENIVIYLKDNAETGDFGQAGGFIIYDKGSYPEGWSYIEAAPADIKIGETKEFIFGYYGGYVAGNGYVAGTSDPLDGKCTGTAIGTGKANFAKLVAKLGNTVSKSYGGTETTTVFAVKVVDEYECGGYDDWFLPSKDELNIMHNLFGLLGCSNSKIYWSSSESSSYEDCVFGQYLGDGYQGHYTKDHCCLLRPIRYF